MNTNLLAVHSIDIFNAATNIKAKKFTHAIVNKEKLGRGLKFIEN